MHIPRTIFIAALVIVSVGCHSADVRHQASQSWGYQMPSDQEAEAFFRSHSSDLMALVAAAQHEPTITFVSADWIGYGTNASDPGQIACAKLLQKLGAGFLRQREEAVEIYFWGSGCAVCHDSYKGFACLTRPKYACFGPATVVRSLRDRDLPKGKHGGVLDGTYLLPISDHWHVIRWECG